MEIPNIVGKSFTFEDGVKCEIIQIKQRNDGPWVTYHIHGKSIPKKVVMPLTEFLNHFGHLFES